MTSRRSARLSGGRDDQYRSHSYKQRGAFDARLRDVLAPYVTSATLARRLRKKQLAE